ncbi:hypothetical protein NPIL_427741 [Nephila pilipes]|uniref:Uncharacterized protein n=1 Tax=Nephila pilipes TaxID=299642 RepID=A0A8X6PCB1_NEPPI|nr:hypothetical protein NPIL_427741 [Nephila pilipes]
MSVISNDTNIFPSPICKRIRILFSFMMLTTTPTEVIVIGFLGHHTTSSPLVRCKAKARIVIYSTKAVVLITGLRQSINVGIGFPESVGNTGFEKGGKVTKERGCIE